MGRPIPGHRRSPWELLPIAAGIIVLAAALIARLIGELIP